MAEIIASIIAYLLRALVPAIIEAAPDKPEDGAEQPELREALRAKIARTWGTAVVLALVACLASGCFTRVVYVKTGEPVRLREPIRKAKIWALGADGKPAAGKMDLPEGWYCLPMDAKADAAVPALRDSEVR
jgi:hypothetical protein